MMFEFAIGYGIFAICWGIFVICLAIWAIKYVRDNTINNKDIERSLAIYRSQVTKDQKKEDNKQ
jgi:hypothetical protein